MAELRGFFDLFEKFFIHFTVIYALQKAKMYKIIYILLGLYIFVRVAQKYSYIFVHFLR